MCEGFSSIKESGVASKQQGVFKLTVECLERSAEEAFNTFSKTTLLVTLTIAVDAMNSLGRTIS
jgi:hypothetical protein